MENWSFQCVKNGKLPQMFRWYPKHSLKTKICYQRCLRLFHNYVEHMYVYILAYYLIICFQVMDNWSLECVKKQQIAANAFMDALLRSFSLRFSFDNVYYVSWLYAALCRYTVQPILASIAFENWRIDHNGENGKLPRLNLWIPQNISIKNACVCFIIMLHICMNTL